MGLLWVREKCVAFVEFLFSCSSHLLRIIMEKKESEFVPFKASQLVVPSSWIDRNGHMNSRHYGEVVYKAHSDFQDAIGIDESYTRRSRCGKVVLESHMTYEREIHLGDELQVVSWLLAIDQKRFHFFHEVYNLTLGVRAAVAEQVDIHIDLKSRRSSVMPEHLFEGLKCIVMTTLREPTRLGVGSIIKPPVNFWMEN